MGEYKLISITNSNKSGKKLMAKFKNKKTGRESTTHFGASGYDDYTIKKDKEQRKRYRDRHRGDNSTSKQQNIRSFKSKFNL